MMRKIYVIRHGETEWNRLRYFQGQTDIPLNENGRLQAARLADELKGVLPFDRIVSSDLVRATETAEILNRGYNMPILVDPGLREVHFGEWEGLDADTINRQWPGELQKWFETGQLQAPGGEPPEMFGDRVWQSFRHWAEMGDYQKMAILTHGGTCRMLMNAIQEKPLRESTAFIMKNTETLIVNVDDQGRYSIEAMQQ